MKHFLPLTTILMLLVLATGCGDDDNVVGSGAQQNSTATSTWDDTGRFWRTTVDASDYDDFMYFSFGTKDTISSGTPKPSAEVWDIAFRREVVKLNGGFSTTNNGDVVGANLGVVDFGEITIADTAGVEWVSDYSDYFIDEWYNYNFVTHELTLTNYVYSMVDAGGSNYLKFRIDSLVGAAQVSMGTVYLTYFYQMTPDSKDLSGVTSSAPVEVNDGVGYFDFSSGAQVTPADPANSLEWDIAFSNFDIKQNSGPNGSGDCAAFLAWGELDDPTNIDGFTMQPEGAPLFPDIPGSVLTEWYDYDGQTHQLTSKSNVYLIKTGDKVYKLSIDSYYANIGGVPTSAHYTFNWKQL